MTDLAIHAINDTDLDLVLTGGELLPDDSLLPAVMASLLTDREFAAAADGDRRGWWGDSVLANPDDRDGAHLWRLARRRLSEGTVREAEQSAREALAWLVDDAVAQSVQVSAHVSANDRIDLAITLQRPEGVERYRLADLWDASTRPTFGIFTP